MATSQAEIQSTRAGDGETLVFEVIGHGEPVILVHGSWTSRRCWNRQRETLARHFRLVLRDLRGLDGSPTCVPPDYSFETTEVSDMLAVMDCAGLESANIVAHSTGGAIALAFAIAQPERVRRLLLAEPTLVSLMTDEMFEPFLTLPGIEEGAFVDTSLAFVLGEGWRTRVSPAAAARFDAQGAIERARGIEFLRRRTLDEGLTRLKVPALVIYGDQGVWPADGRTRVQETGADVRVIAGAGHNVNVDQADVFDALVMEFLRQ